MSASRLLAIAVASLVLAGAGATAAFAWPAETTDNVNVRQGPGTAYPVLFALPAGSPVEVGGCQPGWCWVGYGGSAGWMSSRFLSTYAPYAPPYDPPYYPPPPPPYPYGPRLHLFFGFGSGY